MKNADVADQWTTGGPYDRYIGRWSRFRPTDRFRSSLARGRSGAVSPNEGRHAADNSRRPAMLFRSRTAALVLIVVGGFFLLSNLGWIPQLGPLVHQWWPLILIVIGVLMLIQRR